MSDGLDQKRALIKWANQPFSYIPTRLDAMRALHQAAAQYYRERGYMPMCQPANSLRTHSASDKKQKEVDMVLKDMA